MFEIYDGKQEFTQWDINQKLIVKDRTIKEVHFNNALSANALICVPYELDGLLVVNVPNILLQEALRLYVYAFCGECVRASADYEVKPRVKPSDYVYTETEVKGYAALDNRLTEVEELTAAANEVLEDTVKEVAANGEQLEALTLAIGDKADKEEWITIADTTLTEDVVTITINKDIQGNDFEYDNFRLEVFSPLNYTTDAGYSCWLTYAGTKGSYSDACRLNFANNTFKNTVSPIYSELKKIDDNCFYGFVVFNASTYLQAKSYKIESNFIKEIRFNFSTNYNVPAGTQIKVWGLKA